MDNDHYPALYEVAADRSHSLSGRLEATVGSGAGVDIELTSGSGQQTLFRLTRHDHDWFLEPQADAAAVSVNQASVSGSVRLAHLGIIQAGPHVLVFLAHDDATVSTQYSANFWLAMRLLDRAPLSPAEFPEETQSATIEMGETLQVPLDRLRALAETVVPLDLPGTIDLPEEPMLMGRDSSRVDICLPDVRISRVHARIHRQGRTATLEDLGSANGTFVDGQPIQKPTVVREGARIQVGPHTLIFRAAGLYPLSHDNNVQLVARNLVRRVADRKQRGQTKVILDDITLVVRPREFVCILGPSGSGKTTLLSALAARVPADEGTVLLNGENLYAHFDALKQNLAVVPQQDVLHDVLPLQRALWYTARLRLPADMSRGDIESRIDEALDTVNLVQRQFTPIRQLSGGQIRRASWANEAICNPSLIFLDEVTSGLDEQADAEMMALFRRMADEGKTLICVTHSLSNVEQNCHLVVILAAGGTLAFVGTPADALNYFDIPRLGDVYQRLSEQTGEEWKKRFQQSQYYREYVQRRLPDAEEPPEAARAALRWQPRELLTAWRQFTLLARRYLAIQWADRRALLMILGQALIIAGLLVWLFGDISQLEVESEAKQLFEVAVPGISWDDPYNLEETKAEFRKEAEIVKRMDRTSKLLFLLCISCIWFGCNNAAKEIVKERTIYSKERDVGLKVLSYYGSKLALLGVLSVLQASLLYAIVDHFTHVSGDTAQQWLLLSLAALVGVAMGLAISALARTEDLAVTIVPMVLIPQIILAGLIAPLLHYTRPFAQVVIPAYWSYQGLLRSLDEELQRRLSDGDYLNLDASWTSLDVYGVLAAYVLVFAAVALAALYYRRHHS